MQLWPGQRRRIALRGAGLAVTAGLAIAAPATAHWGWHAPVEPGVTAAKPDVRLRGCFMTVAVVPRPAMLLEDVLRDPLTPMLTAYSSDPVVALWALRCKRARVGGARLRRTSLSLVGVPVEARGVPAAPPANDFAHSVLRADTDRARLARAFRRAGTRTNLARRIRYRHSPPGDVPSTATVVVPGQYRLDVSASILDQPHDHQNRFDRVRLAASNANDLFCLPGGGDCTARLAVRPRSRLLAALGRPPAQPVIAFEHLRLRRVLLSLGG